MRRFTLAIVILAPLIFLGGGIAAYLQWITVQSYAVISGTIGGLASVAGLTVFLSPKFTAGDFKGVESDLLENVAKASKAVEESEKAIGAKRAEISQLEKERRELELLVRLASLRTFHEERLKATAKEIESKIDHDLDFRRLLIDHQTSKDLVAEMDGQISSSPNADKIEEVLQYIREQRPFEHSGIMPLPSESFRRGSLAFYFMRGVEAYARAIGIR